jgi:tetratricopeptide (TPR) repeat protein
MTMFQKPNVGVAFSPQEAVVEEPVYEPRREAWANTPARRWAQAWLLAVLCIVAFVYPTIGGDFLPTDQTMVSGNPMLYSVLGLKTIWGTPQRLPQLSPVAYSVLLVEHQFFVAKPRGYRIISICLHICNVLLLWFLLRRLELPAAWLAAALFAIHPVQVDAVSWISQQRYLICALFYLCALLVYLRRAGLNPVPPPPQPGAEPLIEIGLPENAIALYAMASALFVLALLSHILAATFPVVVLVLIWWERGKLNRKDIVPLIPFAAVSALFVAAAAWLFYHRTGRLWLAFPGGLNWIVIWGRGIWTYLLATILPVNLVFAYPRWTADSIRLWQWIYPVSAIGVLAALWRLRRRWGRGPITAAMLFVCLLLPSALGAADPNDEEMVGVMIREHVLYLACAAILIPLAVFLSGWLADFKWTAKLVALPGVKPVLALLIVFSLAIVTFAHSQAYINPRSLWENVLHSENDSAVALNTLGQLELDQKEFNSAEQHFLAAYRANPGDVDAEMNLAHLAKAQNDYVTAVDRYDEVLAHHPDNVDAHFGLGQVLAAQDDTIGAMTEYDKVEQIDPRNAMVYNNRGLLYAQLGEVDNAVAQYKKAIAIDPRSMAAYINLANEQFQTGKFLAAKDTLEKALQIDPQSYVAWLNAGVMAQAVGDMVSAERYFRDAIYCQYDGEEAFKDLGILLMRRGDLPGKTDRIGEAIYCFKHACELNPDDDAAAKNLIIAQRRKDDIIRKMQQ